MVMKLIKRRFFVLALAGAVLLMVGVISAWIGGMKEPVAVEAAAPVDWGLSFQTEGEAPLGNATKEYLETFDALYTGNTKEKTVYVTFDAGFENGNTAAILDALKKHEVKATFFLVGNFFETQPELVKRMAEEGHTVANHTYSHPDMSKIADKESFAAELTKNEALFKEITGRDMPKLYRPPQGKFCEENLKMAQELGYKTVFWSLAYVDWYTEDQPTKEQAFSKLIPRVHPGAVVLLHSTSTTNAQILDELLSKWEEMGYTFGDLEALCGEAQQ